MARAKKTKACAKVAAVAFVTMFCDISGVSLAIFLAASTGTAVGVTYHGVRIAANGVVNLLKKCKDGDAEDLLKLDKREVEEIEEIIRKLASTFLGITISGGLALVLPHQLIGTAMGVREFRAQVRKLRSLATEHGMSVCRLLKSISKLDIAAQIAAGFVLKAAFTIVFLGHDFEVWADGIGYALQSGNSGGGGVGTMFQDLAKDHNNLIAHGFLKETTAVASGPSDVVTKLLTGSDTTPVWQSDTPGTAILGIGMTDEATDIVLKKVVEEPADRLVSYASRPLCKPVSTMRVVKIVQQCM